MQHVSTSVANRAVSDAKRAAFAAFRALRPQQWVKNGLVFAGVVFGGKLFDPFAVASAAAAAVCFCLLSSGFYLVNDIRDAETDRAHPLKRERPVAAGELSIGAALVLAVSLIGLALAGAFAVNAGLFLVLLAYAALMVAYNAGLKQVVILDVMAIAAGFVLRAAGAPWQSAWQSHRGFWSARRCWRCCSGSASGATNW